MLTHGRTTQMFKIAKSIPSNLCLTQNNEAAVRMRLIVKMLQIHDMRFTRIANAYEKLLSIHIDESDRVCDERDGFINKTNSATSRRASVTANRVT